MDKLIEWFCRLSLIALILIFLNSMIGDMIFRFQYAFPKVTTTSNAKIKVLQDPIQVDLDGRQYIKAYGEKNKYALNLQAEYSLSGLVVAKNTNFWFRDIMRSKFDDIALLDLGIVWGDLARDKNLLYKNVKFKSTKTLGQARSLEYRTRVTLDKLPWSFSYVETHLSHTHMIPANANVMGALLKIKKNDIVKLDGYLVDIYTDKSEIVAKTSLSRSDKNSTSRGYGACEDMYVKQVQIGKDIYK